MIGNAVSLFLGVIEMMVFSNAFYGFPFVQYIFTKERIYMNEKCNATQIEEDIMCEAAQESLGRIWTIGVMVASAGPVIFGFVQPKIGLCYTRLICGSSTTLGLFLMSYYKVNPAMLFFGAIFLALPAISYIVLNTVIAPLYKKITVILIVIIPGMVNSSATSMLIAKKMWQNSYPDVHLESIFLYLAIGSIVIHLRTIFLMPFSSLPKPIPDNYSLFDNSLFSHLFFKKDKESKIEETDEKVGKATGTSMGEYMPILSKLNYWQYLFYYTILTFRINTIRGWMYTWIQWTFAEVKADCGSNITCADEAQLQVSTLLDLNGYSYFALALIPFIPAMMIKLIGNITKSELSGKIYGLVLLMGYCVVFSIVNSIQMCNAAESVEDTSNTIALIILSVSIVPLHYSTPCVFLTTFFPMDLFPFLYGIMKIPSIILMVVNEPLYNIILQGDDIVDADFKVVSIGLGVVTGLTTVCVFYTLYQGRIKIKTEQDAKDEAELETMNPENQDIVKS